MPRIVAYDLSLAGTGYASNEPIPAGFPGAIPSLHRIQYGVLKPVGLRDMERINWIRSQVLTLAQGADMVVMEGLSYGSNDPSAQERAGLAYIIRYGMHCKGIRYELVAPSQLKKFVCSAGNATKELMLKEVFKRYEIDLNDNNAADAVGLSYLGLALMGELEPANQAQREVLAAIKKKQVGTK